MGHGGDVEELVHVWRAQARWLLDAVGWGGEQFAHRRFKSGVSLAAVGADRRPLRRHRGQRARLGGGRGGARGRAGPRSRGARPRRLRRTIAEERNPGGTGDAGRRSANAGAGVPLGRRQ